MRQPFLSIPFSPIKMKTKEMDDKQSTAVDEEQSTVVDEEQSTAVDEGHVITSILMRFNGKNHKKERDVVVAMGHEIFEEENVAPTWVAVLNKACSSLSSSAIAETLIVIMSIVMPEVPEETLDAKIVSDALRWFYQSRKSPRTAIAISSAVICTSHWLISMANHRRPSLNWLEDASLFYKFLLGFCTCISLEVRKQTRLCIRDVLQSFQGTVLLTPASQVICNFLKDCKQDLGKESVDIKNLSLSQLEEHSRKPNSFRKGLYCLDIVEESLCLMPIEYRNQILNEFTPLLEVHNSLVAIHVTNCLYRLCVNPALDVPTELLLNLLCSLCHSISQKKIIDNITPMMAGLLNIGVARVYSSNREICLAKLPIVFDALKVMLGEPERKQVVNAAADIFKSLLCTCIDESLIKQEAHQILRHDASNSEPTIIMKVCAAVQSLLEPQYKTIWNLAFEVISTMFDKLGEYSSHFMTGTLVSLADMQKLSDEEFPSRKKLHECLGSALVAMGPDTFLRILPLNLEAEDLSGVNIWLFPILTRYLIGARLSFFKKPILGVVTKLQEEKSAELQLQRHALVHSLWSLLPSFCNYACDTANSFKDIVEDLCSALRGEPMICEIICSSLQILIRQNKRTAKEADDLLDNVVGGAGQRAMANYNSQVTQDNLMVLKDSAGQILSVLRHVWLVNTKCDGQLLQSTIGEFASISNISHLFGCTMKMLFMVTQEATEPKSSRDLYLKRKRLFDFAVSLLPGLKSGEVDVLFSTIKRALEDKKGLSQKKAYKTLLIILRNADGFLERNLVELLLLMFQVSSDCASAKQHRLECLYLLVVHLLKSDIEQWRLETAPLFLKEIILALKQPTNTRNRAYDILVQICYAFGNEEKGRNRGNLHKFFKMVAEGLDSKNPHMISATMYGLARLTYEFPDLVSTASSLLPSNFLLCPRKSEDIKAMLGFLEVLVVKSPSAVLQLHAKSIVEDLLNCHNHSNAHSKATVELLLSMLVQKCGNTILPVMSQQCMELLPNVSQMKEHGKERKLGSNSCFHRWDHREIFPDSDEETVDAKTISSRSKSKGDQSKPVHSFRQSGGQVDLLGRERTSSSLPSTYGKNLNPKNCKRNLELDDGSDKDSDDGTAHVTKKSKGG